MTVQELVKGLQALPQDLEVLVDGYEGGLSAAHVRRTIAHPSPVEWYGSHAECQKGAPVVVISRHEVDPETCVDGKPVYAFGGAPVFCHEHEEE
jgi:hypothetical protein